MWKINNSQRRLNFWYRVLIAGGITTLLLGLFTAVFNTTWAGRYTTVGLWTIVNFWLLGEMIEECFRRKSWWKIQALVFLKVPVWYSLGFLIILYQGLEITSFLAGFNTIFLVLIVMALGSNLAEAKHQEAKT